MVHNLIKVSIYEHGKYGRQKNGSLANYVWLVPTHVLTPVFAKERI